jgi:hypothetical protein
MFQLYIIPLHTEWGEREGREGEKGRVERERERERGSTMQMSPCTTYLCTLLPIKETANSTAYLGVGQISTAFRHRLHIVSLSWR